MFVTLKTTDGKQIAVNPLTVAVIAERDPEVTVIETAEGSEYSIAEEFRDVKVKMESAINEYRRQQRM